MKKSNQSNLRLENLMKASGHVNIYYFKMHIKTEQKK